MTTCRIFSGLWGAYHEKQKGYKTEAAFQITYFLNAEHLSVVHLMCGPLISTGVQIGALLFPLYRSDNSRPWLSHCVAIYQLPKIWPHIKHWKMLHSKDTVSSIANTLGLCSLMLSKHWVSSTEKCNLEDSWIAQNFQNTSHSCKLCWKSGNTVSLKKREMLIFKKSRRLKIIQQQREETPPKLCKDYKKGGRWSSTARRALCYLWGRR